MNFMDDAVLLSLKSDTISRIAYNAALLQSSMIAPGLLQFFCMCYNKILTETSKKQIDEFIQNDTILSTFFKKYKMIIMMCKNEPLDPMDFYNKYKVLVDNLFKQIGIATPPQMQLNDDKQKYITTYFVTPLNNNIVNVLKLMTEQKEKIATMLSSIKIKLNGGKLRTKRKRVRKLTKRRQI